MAEFAIPVRRCSMPDPTQRTRVCGQVMQSRAPAPAAEGAHRVVVSRCMVCDVRKCKPEGGHPVQSMTATHCPTCGIDLMRVTS